MWINTEAPIKGQASTRGRPTNSTSGKASTDPIRWMTAMSMDLSALDLTKAFQPAWSSAPNSTAQSTGQVRARISGGKRRLDGGKSAAPCPRQVMRQRRRNLVRVLRKVVRKAQLHRIRGAGLGDEASRL